MQSSILEVKSSLRFAHHVFVNYVGHIRRAILVRSADVTLNLM
jgi:hypothetical protein